MDKQYFDPNKDGFYGACYPNKERTDCQMINFCQSVLSMTFSHILLQAN